MRASGLARRKSAVREKAGKGNGAQRYQGGAKKSKQFCSSGVAGVKGVLGKKATMTAPEPY